MLKCVRIFSLCSLFVIKTNVNTNKTRTPFSINLIGNKLCVALYFFVANLFLIFGLVRFNLGGSIFIWTRVSFDDLLLFQLLSRRSYTYIVLRFCFINYLFSCFKQLTFSGFHPIRILIDRIICLSVCFIVTLLLKAWFILFCISFIRGRPAARWYHTSCWRSMDGDSELGNI